MRHRRRAEKLGMKAPHKRQVMANLATSLILNGKVDTTFERAKAARRFSERLITLGRRGDLHARRIAFSRLGDKVAVDRLFTEVGPKFADRPGGYTRVVKLGPRRGDGAEQARLMLVE